MIILVNIKLKRDLLVYFIELSCTDPRPFAYGAVIGRSYIPGSVLKFSCQPGFQLVGKKEVTCSKGQWFGTLPRCVGKRSVCLQEEM